MFCFWQRSFDFSNLSHGVLSYVKLQYLLLQPWSSLEVTGLITSPYIKKAGYLFNFILKTTHLIVELESYLPSQ